MVVFALLFVLSLGCSLVAGLSMASAPRRPLGHQLAFAAVIAVTVFVILELEQPRRGLIRVDRDDGALLELRASMD